ncbi:MAG: DUF86 domain-containing protein [Bryobacteraceae bacterium]|nr:DUF86 domain-containing protein [Bryobacteraceae bacterium]
MTRDLLYVTHVLECIARIARYTAGGRERFVADEMAQDAVVRNLQVLAESTQKIGAETKAAHSEVEWRSIAGFRNVLVHNYLGLDVGEVWSIVETDLPRLGAQMRAIREELAGESGQGVD